MADRLILKEKNKNKIKNRPWICCLNVQYEVKPLSKKPNSILQKKQIQKV